MRKTSPPLFWGALSCLLVGLVLFSWMLVNAQAPDPSLFGQWTTLANLPFFPVHAHLLPTGKVMIWAGDTDPNAPHIENTQQWDPANQTVTPLALPGWDLFCSGHTFLADGRLFVAGGHIQNGVGSPKAGIYNPSTNTWATAPNMNAGRWYPTVTTLANGDALVVSGSLDSNYGVNTLPQVYAVGTNTWRSLTSAQLAMDLYPMMFLAPNGQVFNPAPTSTTRYLDTSGTGAWSYVADRTFTASARTYGSAVMYDVGKILVLGGGDPPTNTAEVIDLNQPSPSWRAVASMSIARRQVNATLLPDGTVLVTGGTSGPGFNDETNPVYPAELWDPATETWRTLASATVPRLYHSAATLLPDGRVFSTGGNNYVTPESFSPPYLFKGARPTMSGVPATIGYGQHFGVQSPDAAAIRKVTLIRITSVTHAFNMNQRLNVLSFTPGSGTLDIVAPATANVAPPGHYLLFLVNANGVPSVGGVVRLDAAVPPGATLTSLSPSSGPAGGPAFTLTVTGSNFANGATVRWSGGSRTTTFVSASQLTAAITAADIAVAGTAQVTVVNPNGGLSNALPFTTTSGSCPCSIWPSTATPAVASNNDPNNIEVGVRFQSDSAGYIKGIRFYKGSSNTGPHTGKLWTASGALMASATFSGETASGWQEVRFATPVAIAANTTYVASYYTVSGFESVTVPYFTSQVASPPLRALANGDGGGNGLYRYGAGGGFPTSTFNSANYWVDVVFDTTAGSGSGPTLTALAPSSAPAGGPGFTLTVTGANFVSGATVRWNGSNRTTTFGSASQLTAAIPAADIAGAGTAQVTVVNPDTSLSNALPFTTNAAPTLTSLSPSSAPAGGPAFTLTVTGTNFASGASVRWNGGNRTTTFVSASQLTAAIPAADIAGAGTAQVTVVNPDTSLSNALPFTTNAAPTLSALSPSSALAGGPAFTLTVTGTNFVSGASVRWNGGSRTTTFVSASQLTAAIPAADIAVAGTAQVTVANPGGSLSNALPFTTTSPSTLCPCSIWTSAATPAVASNNDPNSIEVGVRFQSDSAGYIKGIRFYKGASNTGPHTGKLWTASGTLLASATFSGETASGWQEVRFAAPVAIAANTTYVASYYTVSGFESVTYPYFTSQVASPPLRALANGDGGSNGLYRYGAGGGFPTSTFNSANYWVDVVFDTTAGSGSGPTLTALSPSSAPAGGPGFTLTVTGANFVSGATVRWNGSNRTTTFGSASQLTAAIPAADIAGAGTAQVTVVNPDTSLSNALPFTTNAAPTLSALSPSSAPAGGPAFTLTVTGTNFASGASVRWNGGSRTTTFVSASQVTAAIPAADIAGAGTAQVTVGNPDGGLSTALPFTITAGPTLSALSPSSALAGGPAFTLTVTGTNFVSGATVRWNGSNRTTTFGSASQLTAAIPAADIAGAGTAQVTVVNPDTSLSNALPFTTNAAPTLASLSPSSAPAGGPAFTLTVTGANFVSGATVRWNGSNRTTTFGSASQLTAAIPAADIAGAGTAQVTVGNPDGGLSTALPFTITAGPTLSALSPSSAPAGGPAFTLTVTGANFVSGASVRWNGGSRTTTFVSASQLTAAIPAADIAGAGTAQVTVGNPDGGLSTALPFTITAGPTLSALSPSSALAGGPAFTLTVTGTNFVSGASVRWNGSNRTTTFVSASQLTGAIPAADIAGAGTAQVTVGNPDGGLSTALPFTITAGPTLSALSPSSAPAGGPAFTLTVTGTNFASGASVRWNGGNRTTTFVSASQLTAAIPAADIAVAGTAQVTVANPGGSLSNALPFTTNAAPTLSALSPSSAPAGGPAFTLTVTGANFVSGATVRWNGGSRTTTFVSASQVTAAIPTADIAVAGTAQVTVGNPDGGLSTALPFTITCPCSIWTSAATPAVASNNDPNSLEIGVRFQSNSAGYIKGIRFYKGASNTGPHTGKLWTATGTLLASATFSGETASGWQEVRFATPVAITANTTYVASYYTVSGFESVTYPYFTSQVSSPPLRALANGDGGGNGLYRYGAGGGFPTLTFQSANYWVDVVFDYNP